MCCSKKRPTADLKICRVDLDSGAIEEISEAEFDKYYGV
jgi:hypothetical protein